MTWRFFALIALSSSPWIYLAAATGAQVWSQMEGFGFLPFAALLFAKEMALNGQHGRSEGVHRPIPGSRIALAATVPFLLVIGLLAVGVWLREPARADRSWMIAAFALLAGASILWDVRRSHLAVVRSAGSAGRGEES